MGKLGPGESSSNRVTRRKRLENPRCHVSDAGCWMEPAEGYRSLQATIYATEKSQRETNNVYFLDS